VVLATRIVENMWYHEGAVPWSLGQSQGAVADSPRVIDLVSKVVLDSWRDPARHLWGRSELRKRGPGAHLPPHFLDPDLRRDIVSAASSVWDCRL